MEQACPHCGTALPSVSDPYCGQCGNVVDEPPAVPLTRTQLRANREAGLPSILWIGGWGMLAAAVYTGFTVSGLEAVVRCTSLVLVGGFALGMAHRRRDNNRG